MLGETILPAAMLSMIPDGTEVDDHDHEAAVRDIRKAAGEYLEAEGDGTPRLSLEKDVSCTA